MTHNIDQIHIRLWFFNSKHFSNCMVTHKMTPSKSCIQDKCPIHLDICQCDFVVKLCHVVVTNHPTHSQFFFFSLSLSLSFLSIKPSSVSKPMILTSRNFDMKSSTVLAWAREDLSLAPPNPAVCSI